MTFLVHLTGKIYTARVRCVRLYGSETWAMKEEEVSGYKYTEESMARWIATLREMGNLQQS